MNYCSRSIVVVGICALLREDKRGQGILHFPTSWDILDMCISYHLEQEQYNQIERMVLRASCPNLSKLLVSVCCSCIHSTYLHHFRHTRGIPISPSTKVKHSPLLHPHSELLDISNSRSSRCKSPWRPLSWSFGSRFEWWCSWSSSFRLYLVC
jgi:hypothetical protein